MSSLVPSLQGEEDTGGRENKGQFITGIQEHSLLGLRSHVAQKQSEARGAAPSRRTRPAANSLLLQFRKTPAHGEHRGHLASLLQRKNKGIDSRMKRDVAGSGPSRGEEVSEEERLAILEDKAKRYESLLFQTQAPSPSSQGGAGTESSKPTLGASKRDLRVQMILELEKETREAQDRARTRKEEESQHRKRVREFWKKKYIARKTMQKNTV